MGKPAATDKLTDDQGTELWRLVRRRQIRQGLVRCAKIAPSAVDGLRNKKTVARLGKDANIVGKWRFRSTERGLDRLNVEHYGSITFSVRAQSDPVTA